MPKFKGDKEKYYQVLSEEKRWMHGAFPHSESGLKQAQKYQKSLEKQYSEKIIIIEG